MQWAVSRNNEFGAVVGNLHCPLPTADSPLLLRSKVRKLDTVFVGYASRPRWHRANRAEWLAGRPPVEYRLHPNHRVTTGRRRWRTEATQAAREGRRWQGAGELLADDERAAGVVSRLEIILKQAANHCGRGTSLLGSLADERAAVERLDDGHVLPLGVNLALELRVAA